MPQTCIPKSVLSSASCKENPAGLSNHLFVVPLDTNHITKMVVNDEKNQYDITPAGGAEAALKGYRIDFKGQTGNYKSEDNGTGKGWKGIGTGRVEMSEDEMAHTSRILHNSDQNIYFLPTGKVVESKKEYIVIGNESGEAEWGVTADTGTNRSDDHGQTFTVTCPYQVYPITKWYGTIEQEDAVSTSSRV
ncbi:MAG: hypothetical protein SPK35_03690 [Prevotella sp.]|nr:hypothetical protein [Prevotella sp.]